LDLFEREEIPILAAGTRRSYHDSLVSLRAYFIDTLGDPPIDGVTRATVKSFLGWRRVHRRVGKHQKPSAEPVSNRTLQKDFTVLQRIFNIAVDRALCEASPVRGGKKGDKPKADPRAVELLTDEQYEALLTACQRNPQLWLYTLTLGETGGRCLSEVLHLQWDDIDLAAKALVIRGRGGHRTKSGRLRIVPMSDRLHAAMRAHSLRVRGALYHGAPSPWVFHHERDRRGCKAGGRVTTFRSTFDTAQHRAGIVDAFHRHDLRHRRATSLLERGANVVDVQELLGHSDVKTTMGYVHMVKSRSRERMASFLNPAPIAPVATKIDKPA
jgi:integrase